ncbi:MAG: peptidase C1 [Deltaproteobacteria bacterium]|nr:peptidase C1 [Deltaproteobacteria bacterium]
MPRHKPQSPNPSILVARLLGTFAATVIALGAGSVEARPQHPSSRAPHRDAATYVKHFKDPILKTLKARDKRDKKRREKATAAFDTRYRKKKEAKKKARRVLRVSMRGVTIPASPKVFKQVFHFSPVAQYLTGTCWAFASTSFAESEVARITGKRIKLSEMHTVYYEYFEKAQRWIHERGHSSFSEGSENDATLRIFRHHGAVPAAVYSGIVGKDKRHDHTLLSHEIMLYLRHVKRTGQWDEKLALASIRLILNKYLGKPPTHFPYAGKDYTPKTFLRDVLKIDPSAYVELMSTKKAPFYRLSIFDVPDNWWRSRDYFNVPLRDFYGVIAGAVDRGYSVATGGDVSEPGKNGFKDAAIIPTYDIPQAYINQDSRELRIANGTTTDDHGIHLVGHTKLAGHDWFLIKDSGRSARMGKAKGYYYFRDDFIRLKMLTATVHRDALPPALRRRYRAATRSRK